MSSIAITTSGERELGARLESIPAVLHQKLTDRIQDALVELWERTEEVVPHLTGRLASEIRSRLYSDARNRVAGYISVYAADPGPHNEYAKAAALEYGSKGRKETGISARLSGRSISGRISAPVGIAAQRYLRGPFDEMRPEILAAIEKAIEETVAEGEA